ncbi:phosphoglucosamine mutase [candidate division KSB1 bacterium]|nr:phosphoglucosamine mutase [candidate division KSB1 bacterium]
MISISGVRGLVGKGLSPDTIARFATAFGTFTGKGRIMVGRDGRASGEMVKMAVFSGLTAVGCNPVDIGIVPTPTVQLATQHSRAVGGIAITASHNPIEWNALKFFNKEGLFLTQAEADNVVTLYTEGPLALKPWDKLGRVSCYDQAIPDHINAILGLKFLDAPSLRDRIFRIVLDGANGAGALLVPKLLQELGCGVIKLHCEITGKFDRPPEPLPENLTHLGQAIRDENAEIGFALDPDGDRLAIVDEYGKPIGEEYTLALACKFLLGKKKGPVVTNLSTTRAIDGVAAQANCPVVRTKVGEIHVVEGMKRVGAVIGGEGNGGVIFPDLHYGRDAALAIVLILQYLSDSGETISQLVSQLPHYVMVKRRMKVDEADPKVVIRKLREKYSKERLDLTDGIRIDRNEGWVHVRPSNTEPVLRIFAEAKTQKKAENLVREIKALMKIQKRK